MTFPQTKLHELETLNSYLQLVIILIIHLTVIFFLLLKPSKLLLEECPEICPSITMWIVTETKNRNENSATTVLFNHIPICIVSHDS